MQPQSTPMPATAPAPRRPRRRVLLTALIGLALVGAIVGIFAVKTVQAAGPHASTTTGPGSGPRGACAAPMRGTPTTGTPDADADHPGPGGPFGGPHGPGRGELTVTAIKGSDVTTTDMQNATVTVHTSASTTYMKDCQTAKFSDIAVGDALHVQGTRNSDGSITATRIDIMLPHAGGKITKLSGSTITVSSRDNTTQTITVTSSTIYTDAQTGKSSSLSALKVGNFIVAEGTRNSDGSLTATAIHLLPAGGFPGGPRDGPPHP